MIEVPCDICTKPLDRPGGLVFGPPDDYGNTKKRHVCVPCWQSLPSVARVVGAVKDPMPEPLIIPAPCDTCDGDLECPGSCPPLASDDQNLAEHTALTRGFGAYPQHPAPPRKAKPADRALARCVHCQLGIRYNEVVDDWTTGIAGTLADFSCEATTWTPARGNRNHEPGDPII